MEVSPIWILACFADSVGVDFSRIEENHACAAHRKMGIGADCNSNGIGHILCLFCNASSASAASSAPGSGPIIAQFLGNYQFKKGLIFLRTTHKKTAPQ